jgi:hypothetical protein
VYLLHKCSRQRLTVLRSQRQELFCFLEEHQPFRFRLVVPLIVRSGNDRRGRAALPHPLSEQHSQRGQ